MALFRKKEDSPKTPLKSPHKSLGEIVTERVLTTEGWQRRTLLKVAHQQKKTK